ncbi:MAG: EAL domain-containing protein [Rhodospirillales bacterium]|nr:MAG: EAL domain-containing protein [Rhodospirillales bacterium]
MSADPTTTRGLGRLQRRWAVQLAALLLSATVFLMGGFDPLERALVDLRFELTGRDASGELVIVAIDPESLRQLSVWPWPRTHHAAVVDRLVEAGAARIALDIDFSSASDPAADAALADALAGAPGRVILPVFRQNVAPADGRSEVVHTAPLPSLRRHARLASVSAVPDADGLIRRHSMNDFWRERLVPTMPGALTGWTSASAEIFHIDYGIRPESIPMVSYVDVMRGRIDPNQIRGKAVIVGATAVELGDVYAVPLYKALPGPVVQALAYESLVQERTLYRVAEWVVLFGAALVAIGFGRRFQAWSWRRGAIVLLAFTVSLFALALGAQAVFPVLLELTPCAAVAIMLYGTALVRRIDRQELVLTLRGNRMRRNNALMRSVVENSSEAILTISDGLIIELVNPAAARMFGEEASELTGRELDVILPAVKNRETLDAWHDNAEPGIELQAIARDGTGFEIEAMVDKMSLDGTCHYILVARDITERKAQQNLLEYLALHDPLTSLPNRTLLMDRLDHAIAASKRSGSQLALLILDLDRFKEINDTLGHGVGDSLLIAVGQTLGAPLRASDTVARLGGDEFAILLPAVSGLEVARDVAERIAVATSQPFQVEDLTLEVGVSIGAALYPDHGDSAAELMRAADVAMYVAKRDATTIAIYDEDRDHNSVRNLSLGGELRRAMDEDELVLFYQPQIELAGGRLSSAEVLIRWDHPRYGLVPPVEFITLAEQSGLIGPLTRWILRSALAHLGAWQSEGYEIGLAVNLSPRNLLEEDLASSVEELLEVHSIKADTLTLEITEDAIMTDPERALGVIGKLRARGVRIAIDDFGTGHSSLAYLTTLPVDELKIDKSFVLNMGDRGTDALIVRSMIELAHDLDLSVVAEGIEDESVLDSLRELDCDVGQGYHIGRPMRREAFDRWMRAQFAADTEEATRAAAPATAQRRTAARG